MNKQVFVLLIASFQNRDTARRRQKIDSRAGFMIQSFAKINAATGKSTGGASFKESGAFC